MMIIHDPVFCALRGLTLDASVCEDSCVAPEQRPVCWIDADAFFARDLLGDPEC